MNDAGVLCPVFQVIKDDAKHTGPSIAPRGTLVVTGPQLDLVLLAALLSLVV